MIVLLSGMDGDSIAHGQHSMFDITTNSWSELLPVKTKPQHISRVVGSVIKQFDETICDVVHVSADDKKMYICR